MSEKKTVVVRSGGIGFMGLLTLLFIALKLTGYIAWPWLWVLSPLWLPPAIVIGIFAAIALVAAVAAVICFTVGIVIGICKR